METNNFPDRIYLPRDAEYPQSPDIWWEKEPDESNVEYIRTDAFIEQATEWLNNFYNEETRSYLIGEDIEKFINYMKGG